MLKIERVSISQLKLIYILNKIKILAIGLIVVLIGFVACKKVKLQDSITSTNSEFTFKITSEINYSDITIKTKGFKGENGSVKILAFKDMNSFKATLSELERQTKEYNSAFVSLYSNLDDEDLNAKEEEIGFDDEKPLSDFEHHFNFISLRNKIVNEEEEWLNHEVLDENNDPTDQFDFLFNEEMTLLNRDAEVIIGGSVFKLVNNGYYEIFDGDIQTLSSLENISSNDVLPENVLFVDGNSNCSSCKSGGCNSNKRNSGKKNSGSYRIKWVVSHWTNPWERRVAAKTKNYKKRGWRWKKYTTYCKARVYGSISDLSNNANCSKQLVFNIANGYYAEDVEKKVKHKITVQTKSKSGWVKGYFYGAGGISHNKTLTW